MKIIYLHQYFNTPEMSGGTRSYEMARRLVEWGHEVHMITSKRKDIQKKNKWYESNEAGIHVHWYPIPYSNKMNFTERIKAFLKFVYVSSIKAASFDADIIFATSTPLTIALPGIYAAKRLKVPFIFEVRDLWPQLPIAIGALNSSVLIKLARALEKFAYSNAAQIIALSPGMKEGVVKTGYPDHKVHIISNSSDLDFFDVPESAGSKFRAQYEWLRNRPLVVYTGTLGMINGVSYLAGIAAKVKEINPEIRFLIIGDGIEYQKVKKSAEDLGVLNQNFYMLGRISKREMPKVLSAADITTSLFIDLEEMWANSANKFFDGLASGTPVAINYQGWQAKMLCKENAGLILSANNIDKASKELVEKISDRNWLKQAGINAKELAAKEFHRDKLAKKMEKVLTLGLNTSK